MAISSGDWSSATDPFLFATDVSYSSTVGELSDNRIRLNDSYGLLNGIIDKERQDLFWQNDGDSEKAWAVSAMRTNGSGIANGYPEFGGFDQDIGGGTFQSFYCRDLIHDDPKTAYIYVTGRSAGAVLYSLFCYVALCWNERDPAQILFSWIAFHLDNSDFSMRDYLDQTSFQDASDYYDANPCGLTAIRQVGTSIAEQAKILFHHVADFLAITPAGSDRSAKLRILVRGALYDRTTPIELDGRSVRAYTVRPTDRYRIDRIDARFGAITMLGGSNPDDAADYLTGFPIEFPHDSRNTASQKVGGQSAPNKISVDLPYHRTRQRVLNHLDLRYWKDDQDEVEVEFCDWSHFNFDVGDMVHFTGRGYDGTENFVVTEKELDIDTLQARARFLQLRGHNGKSAQYADGANLICNLRPNTLGHFVDGTSTYPKTAFIATDPRILDRWFCEADYSHGRQINRGTGGPAGANPSPPKIALDELARWPVVEFDALSGLMQSVSLTSGFSAPHTSPTACDFTIYAVVRVDDVAALTADIWTYSYSGSGFGVRFASGVPKYYQGVTIGSGSALGGWQIVVWTLKSAASSTVRRNGVQLFSGGAFTQVALNNAGSFSIGCNNTGTGGQLDGAIAELAIFKTAHDVATTQQIEAHLSEKYGIAI